MKEQMIEVFTDGGCWGNPGPGGWGALLRSGKHERKISGYEAYTSNNRMEMTAAIEALNCLKLPSKVCLTTDSSYLKDGITQWLAGWKKKGWKTSGQTLVKNIDLWQRLDALIAIHEVQWVWVKGHNGHAENEMADALAQGAIRSFFAGLKIDVSNGSLFS